MYLTFEVYVALLTLGTVQLEILKLKKVFANVPVSGIIEADPPLGGKLPVIN